MELKVGDLVHHNGTSDVHRVEMLYEQEQPGLYGICKIHLLYHGYVFERLVSMKHLSPVYQLPLNFYD